jgi:uncharacterized protein
MSAHSVTTPPPEVASPPRTAEPVRAEADRYEGIEQYSLKKIVAVWAAAAVPMGVLAWVVAPLLQDLFSGPEPLVQSLLVCLTAGLAWQFVLVLILLRQEIGSFEWSRVRDALWLRAPRDAKTGRVGGKIWWWALPFLLGFAAWAAVAPELPIPDDMDLNKFLGSDTGQDFFSGAWGWFAVIVALAVFNTVLGEELLFRGVLLPRMRGVFGKTRLGRQRRDLCALPPAHAVGDPADLCRRHLPRRLPFTALSERVDGNHRALSTERAAHRAVPRARSQLAVIHRSADV